MTTDTEDDIPLTYTELLELFIEGRTDLSQGWDRRIEAACVHVAGSRYALAVLALAFQKARKGEG